MLNLDDPFFFFSFYFLINYSFVQIIDYLLILGNDIEDTRVFNLL